MTSKKFECSGKNNVTTSFLTYELSLVDPDGPYFIEGTNKTIWSEIKSGSNASLTCTVKSSIPSVTELMFLPPAELGNNRVVKRNDTHVHTQWSYLLQKLISSQTNVYAL